MRDLTNNIVFSEETEELLLEEIHTDLGELSQIVVYNDDVNTFDWVIKCFIEICHHTSEQAEQLSLLVHFKGKAIVKSGPLNVLKPMKDALCERGLSAVIESTKEH